MTHDPVRTILDKLSGVKPTGPGQWLTRCPAHEDDRPSLSVARGDDGRALLHCHAGCIPEAICEALGLTQADLFPKSARKRRVSRKIATTYDYTDQDGRLLYQTVRYDPKGFCQRRPGKNGSWVYKLNGVPRVLYRLPELVKARPNSWVFVVEGEKDVDQLRSLGLTATTNPGGAGKWHKVNDVPLHGRRVAVIPDNDDAGRKHALQVALSLHGHVAELKIVELPDLSPKGDVSNWLSNGGDVEKLTELVEHAPPFDPADAAADDAQEQIDNDDRRQSQADRLVDLTTDLEFFHTPAQDTEGYASVPVDDHHETYQIRGKMFRRWLGWRLWQLHRKTPHAQGMQEALEVISAKALYDGPEQAVSVRLAQQDGTIWLDLANSRWEAIEITSRGWRIVARPPVKFIRKPGMRPLPTPQRGGRLAQLRELVNVPSHDQFVLLVAWLVAAFRPGRPFPILVVNGEQGSAKSTLCRFARSLVDPNLAPLRRPPRSEHDLMIAATNGWVVGFDNLSSIRTELSDSMAMLATGGGFGTRQLYTDDEEKLFDAARPILINGIADLVKRSDLADRVVQLQLPPIPEGRRRDEEELVSAFDGAKPLILGALCDAVCAALRNLPHVRLLAKPRMADFATWIVAAATPERHGRSILGFSAEEFLEAYARNRSESDLSAIETSPVGPAVLDLMQRRVRWQGTAQQLLAALEASHSDEGTRKRRDWPRSPAAMSNALRRLAPNLRRAGIEYSPPIRSGKQQQRILVLEKASESPSALSAAPGNRRVALPAPDSAGIQQTARGRNGRDPTAGCQPASDEPKVPSSSADDADKTDDYQQGDSESSPTSETQLPSSSPQELRRLAEACEDLCPELAATYRQRAEEFEQKEDGRQEQGEGAT